MIAAGFPRFAFELAEPCTRGLVARMLRNRGYRLEITANKKDRGLHTVYMYDPWADPMMVKLGEYWKGNEPDWDTIYDAAMELHLERKADGSRYGD
jgi:hypothetical protein